MDGDLLAIMQRNLSPTLIHCFIIHITSCRAEKWAKHLVAFK